MRRFGAAKMAAPRGFTGAVLRDRSAIVILPSPRRACFRGKLSAHSTNCRAALNSSSLPWNKARRREDKSRVIIDASRAFCRSSLV